tara:strand:- start:935 stop:1318 length:384 start_codon:yes stop_codon:yes gene_type:complete
MNLEIKNLFKEIGIPFEEVHALNGLCIPREVFLNNNTYTSIKEKIPSLKHYFSSSMLTALQKNAAVKQKWPLLNLIRQILKSLYYKMTPIRLSDGYTKEGKKKYRRLFSIDQIHKINPDPVDEPIQS